jgi:7,8-dihydropterin-6-yl-methyl-4-(beta-D-ribofuranosyl)aminobenzene 5'-phosphate synthase
MAKVKITVLCENTVGRLIGTGEHGFSAFIEADQGNYLFDTGSGNSVVSNSLALGKDLRSIRKIFLSHGHQDHTGGLPEVLKLRGKVEVHVHPHVFTDRLRVYEENHREMRRFIGIPYKRSYLETLGACFLFNSEFAEVDKNLYLTGEVPRGTEFEKSDPRLFAVVDEKLIPDAFPDDQSLVLDTEKGLVLVLGCAHAGMINIIHHVMNKMKNDRFYAILGGTHLDFLTPDQVEASVQSLRKISFEKIGVSHCTGMRAASRLYQEFGERFFQGCVGSVLEI